MTVFQPSSRCLMTAPEGTVGNDSLPAAPAQGRFVVVQRNRALHYNTAIYKGLVRIDPAQNNDRSTHWWYWNQQNGLNKREYLLPQIHVATGVHRRLRTVVHRGRLTRTAAATGRCPRSLGLQDRIRRGLHARRAQQGRLFVPCDVSHRPDTRPVDADRTILGVRQISHNYPFSGFHLICNNDVNYSPRGNSAMNGNRPTERR